MKNRSKFVGTNQFSGKTVLDRFWEKIDKKSNDECWEWIGSRHWQWNYGNFNIGGKHVSAHRFSWMIHNEEEIPKGTCICHTCDNPPCCNPNHLFLGTVADNNMDKKLKGRQDERGEKNGMARITETDVINIRNLHHKKGKSFASLGRAYKLTATHIASICRGERWSHVREGLL